MINTLIPVAAGLAHALCRYLSGQCHHNEANRHSFFVPEKYAAVYNLAPAYELLKIQGSSLQVIQANAIAQAADKESASMDDAPEHVQHEVAQVADQQIA